LYSVDLKDVGNQSVAWVQGNAIGIITATGNFDQPTLKGTVRSVRAVASVDFEPRYIDGFNRSQVDRSMTLVFNTGEPIVVDVGRFVAPHYRDRANEFINAVLRAVSR
jgi:hypothetical protein